MKHTLRHLLIFIAMIAMFGACSSNSQIWDEMPAPISKFINRYFPNIAIDTYDPSGNSYYVKLRGSDAMTFGRDFAWESIDGLGEKLPQILLFDQLPPAFYEYLQSIEATDGVYSVMRDARTYNVMLLSGSLTYNIETGNITGSPVIARANISM